MYQLTIMDPSQVRVHCCNNDIIENKYTIWCCYNMVSFLKNSHNRHPIACPWGWDMWCLMISKFDFCLCYIMIYWTALYMMTSSNGNIFRLTGHLCGEVVPGEFPAQRPVMWSFDVFCNLRLNKRLSKQSWGWWFEMQSRLLWCHRNDQNLTVICLPETLKVWKVGFKTGNFFLLNVWKMYLKNKFLLG